MKNRFLPRLPAHKIIISNLLGTGNGVEIFHECITALTPWLHNLIYHRSSWVFPEPFHEAPYMRRERHANENASSFMQVKFLIFQDHFKATVKGKIKAINLHVHFTTHGSLIINIHEQSNYRQLCQMNKSE